MDLSHFSNIGIVRILLSEMYPELVPYAADILEAAASSTRWNEVSFYPTDIDVMFSDGSALKVKKPLPMGLMALGGEIVEEDAAFFSLVVDQMNNYTPILFDLPVDGNVTLSFRGQPTKDTGVNKNGPGVLVRAHATRPSKSDDFKGILGPTLVGGIGNGFVKPSNLRPRPTFLEGTDSPVLLGVVTMNRGEIQLSSPSWETPISFPHQNSKYGAVYFKGIKNITFTIQHHQPPPTPVATAITSGFRMSEIVGSRFSSIQKRAMASSV
jgi:hypothetical protein